MTKAARVFAARFLLALVALLALLPALGAESAWAAQRRVKIAVTSQWLREVASFICGDQATVRSLSVMDEAGRERLVARPARGEIIIAFDAADAARHRISEKNKNLRLLFDKVQVTEDELRGAFFDPAMLPFVAQEIMKAVSKIDPESYAYYQRRLAEFQSRIDSAIGVGRHMLAGSGAKLLDLTGAEGRLDTLVDTGRRAPARRGSGTAGSRATRRRCAPRSTKRRVADGCCCSTRGRLRRYAPPPSHTRTGSRSPRPPATATSSLFFHDMLTMIAARLGENQTDKK